MRRHLKRVGALLGASLLIVCFQNCSDMVAQDGVVWNASLAEYQKSLDESVLPILLDSSGSVAFWAKPTNANYINKDPVFADRWSFVVALSRSATGTVFSVNSNTDSEEGRVSIANGVIRISRISNASNYSYIDVPVPSSGAYMVVAASFAQTAGDSDISVMINGVIQTSTRQKVGTPLDFSWLQKTVATSSAVLESVVYTEILDFGRLNSMSRYVATSENIEGVIYDPALMSWTEGSPGATTSDPYLAAAKAVIDAKCISCHYSGSSGGDLAKMTNAKAISGGWVVVGDPANSKIYYRLSGSSGGGTKNMPASGTITAAEVQAIADWISNIK